MVEKENLSWDKKVDLVVASYNRINDRAGLAREFYNRLFKLNPKIKEYFKVTDFDHQEKALLNGLDFFLQFMDSKNQFARNQVMRLSRSHSFYGMKIHPHHYYYWVEALVKTVKDFDPYWTQELKDLWKEVLNFPISFMIGQYFNKENI